ncbi:hypothetical protein [Pasteurella testudinis]|uniref:hypothetical protein n=1 Tax=Pasteurella testudinis TaxID=761 RepID=UPI00405831C3
MSWFFYFIVVFCSTWFFLIAIIAFFLKEWLSWSPGIVFRFGYEEIKTSLKISLIGFLLDLFHGWKLKIKILDSKSELNTFGKDIIYRTSIKRFGILFDIPISESEEELKTLNKNQHILEKLRKTFSFVEI